MFFGYYSIVRYFFALCVAPHTTQKEERRISEREYFLEHGIKLVFYCIFMRYIALCISLSISSLTAESAGWLVNILASVFVFVFSCNCVAKLCRKETMDCRVVGDGDGDEE